MTGSLTRPILLLLAGLGALGSLAIHMFVPAMPAASADLHASRETIQLAVSIYLVGLGAGQLIAGPISDRIGRRPVLLTGSSLFLLASLAAGFAPSAEWLLTARLVEALSASAALVAARTFVSDLSPREAVAANLAGLTSAVLLSPTIAPTIGGLITAYAGWRAIFWTLSAAALALTLTGAALLPRDPSIDKGPQIRLSHAYVRLARNGRYRRFVAGNTLASSALYVFLSASPFLLIGRWHMAPQVAGTCYLLVAGAGIAGTFAVRRIMARGNAFRLALTGIGAGGALMLVLALAGLDHPAAMIGPMVLVGFACGVAAPTGIAGAMHAEEGLAGTASSLAGAIQMIASAAATSLVGAFAPGTVTTVALFVLVAGAIGAFAVPAD